MAERDVNHHRKHSTKTDPPICRNKYGKQKRSIIAKEANPSRKNRAQRAERENRQVCSTPRLTAGARSIPRLYTERTTPQPWGRRPGQLTGQEIFYNESAALQLRTSRLRIPELDIRRFMPSKNCGQTRSFDVDHPRSPLDSISRPSFPRTDIPITYNIICNYT